MQQRPVVIATPVVATAVSPVASPVDSASVYRSKRLDRRSSRPIMPSCDVVGTARKVPSLKDVVSCEHEVKACGTQCLRLSHVRVALTDPLFP